jgi:aryl-alcohol dehydrogenase-like predicted oxidoreductase
VKYRPLGKSDLEVSEISLGSWLTYGVGVERERAQACVNRAFDLGVNFFDTANGYGRGAAETFLGEVLAAHDRSSYVLATKVFFPMSESDYGLSAAQIRKQLDASLVRLRTEYIDLYQCHRYDAETPLEETMTALTEAVRAGKVRYAGFSEWKPEQIQAAIDLVGSAGVEPFVSSQPQYSILYRRPEAKVIPLCAANGISQIPWSPLAQGLLTGKYRPGQAPPPDSRAASDVMGEMMFPYDDDTLVAVDGLRPIAESLGVSMAQLALAWVLHEPNVASAIIGATKPEQVDDNAAASGVELSDDVVKAIDDVVGGVVQPRPS